jgi:hypothetical protein
MVDHQALGFIDAVKALAERGGHGGAGADRPSSARERRGCGRGLARAAACDRPRRRLVRGAARGEKARWSCWRRGASTRRDREVRAGVRAGAQSIAGCGVAPAVLAERG